MDFDEILDKVREQLQRKGRLAYQALKVRFSLDDQFIEGLKAELIDADRVAVDEDGKVLVWAGDGASNATPTNDSPQSQPPSTYTPQHLA